MRREASIERRPRLATGTSAFAKPKIKARVEELGGMAIAPTRAKVLSFAGMKPE